MKLVQRRETLIEACRGKSVLHLGCTNYPYTNESVAVGTFLHSDLAESAETLYGLDFDIRGIEMLTEMGYSNLVQGDLEKLESLDLNRKFDVIIAGEIIEHLSNPGLFLNGIKRFLAADGILVITTVNAYCAFRAAQYLVSGRGGKNEPVHPDHIAYFSYNTLKVLVERDNYIFKHFFFYDLGNEHRQFVRWFYRYFNDIVVRFAPQLADGVIAFCQIKK